MGTTPTYAVRLPEDLRAKLQAEADRNYRNLAQEIIMRLQKSFEDTDAVVNGDKK